MIQLLINDEFSYLKQVILGISTDFGGCPNLEDAYDPKSKEHVLAGTFPKQEDVINEIGYFEKILTGYGVDVIRPLNIKGVNQIFARDIAFVIGDKIVIPNIIKERKKEIEMLEDVLLDIDPNSIIRMPLGVNVEGGDVILSNDDIFVGYSNESEFNRYTVARTNKQGLNFLENMFPNKKVKGFELIKSDKDARENALHLDCCFQPIGNRMAILYRNGFKNQSDIVFLVNVVLGIGLT